MSDVIYRSAATIVSAAWSRLIEQFKRKNTLRQYIGGLLDPLADVEETLSDFRDAFDIGTTEGDMLDKLGKLVGEARQDRSDTIYRVFIKVRRLVNRSFGRAQDLIGIFDLATTALEGYYDNDPTIHIYEYPPAAFDLEFDGVAMTSDDVSTMATIMGQARGGGINGRLVYSVDETPLFRFAGTGVDDTLNGFGSYPAGGHWAGVVQT